MRLGIDFGTTHTVVACCDRGNYPVLSFTNEHGDSCDYFPSIVAEHEGNLHYGFDALKVSQDPNSTQIRSFKRVLSAPGAGACPDAIVQIGRVQTSILDLLTGFLSALKYAVLQSASRLASEKDDEPLIAVIATPANAHGAQRFVTLDAFKRAGFLVSALLNEPSAAGFEYTHRHGRTLNTKREHIVVYDLGGGTFDASLVHLHGRKHTAIATAGQNHLGGDDFDAVLMDLVLESAKLKREQLPERALQKLAEQCREAKERLNPNSRRIMIDVESSLGELAPRPEITLSTADYYDACTPLVQKTIETMEPVIARQDSDAAATLSEIAGIYVVGGASALPVITRVLRDRFGRRVHRSPYPSAAIAIGLAIAADDDAGFELSDRLSRHFGVFRERRGGTEVVFDPIFDREARVPQAGEQLPMKQRVYRAAHNIGRYRFVECAMLDALGVPHGDMTAFNDVLFPFDRTLRHNDIDLINYPVERLRGEGPLIQEQYAITPHGIVEVTITDLEANYRRVYPVGA